MCLSLRPGDHAIKNEVMKKLLSLQYQRNEIDFKRGTFRSKGDILDVIPASRSDIAVRFEFFGDEIDSISEIDVVTGKRISTLNHAFILPASHYAVTQEKLENAYERIRKDCLERVKEFEKQNKLIEAQRVKERVFYDLEMMKEVGYCSGIENYSRYFDGRKPGEPPYTLIDYFKNNFVVFIDESHMTVPQIRGMYAGDLSRKTNLVEYGFRLPAAYDNRPLNFEEFESKINQVVFVSATPGPYEMKMSDQIVEQIIRPTGLLDPEISVRPIKNQVDDLITEIYKTIQTDGRVLITTLTKKMAEDLTGYLSERKIKVRYLHSDIDTLDRVEIINSLRLKEFDVLVGINLLREGLDIPEVKLVAILDADKEGFLRSSWALIQTIGRAARNAEAKVIMYADVITDSMKVAINETNRRRQIQSEYNAKYGITPKTIIKPVKNTLEITKKETKNKAKVKKSEIPSEIEKLQSLMKLASDSLDFEQAIILRNQILDLKKELNNKKD